MKCKNILFKTRETHCNFIALVPQKSEFLSYFPIAENESQISIGLCREVAKSKLIDKVQNVEQFLSTQAMMLKTPYYY